MKTPETKKGEQFRATAGTPYFEDSHMLSPKKSRTRLGRNKWESEEDNSAEAEDDSDDAQSRDETVKDQIYHLSYDRGDQGGSQYLELRSHVSLDKIPQFDGRRYRSDDSLQWLKRFIYEMKGTRMPQDSWCEPFSLSLGRTAKGWYRQLPRKTQTRWNLLSEVFLDYYCSQFDQSARTRYYSAKRKDKETICDFLTRLNGYARTAKIQYERGGADAADHVEQFLLNCGDDDIMDMLYPLQLNDIHRVEQIINKKILGEKRKKQRDRLVSAKSRDEMRRDDKRDVRRDDRRSDRRREESRDRRINTADYVVEELYGSTGHTEAGRGQLSRDAELYDSEDSDGYSAHGRDEDAESEDDTDYVDAGFTSDRGDSARTPRNSARPFRGPTEGRDRRDTSRERQQYGPCAACGGMVHEVGQCELFRRYEKLASFVKNNVDKSLHAKRFKLGGPPTLTELEFSGLPQSAELAVEADFVFAFVGEAGWPEGSVGTDEGMSDRDGNEREYEESNEDDSAMPRVVKLLRGERLGWWSSQKFDRRVRMRALVMGAVNDRRVKILLDTGANVSAVSSTLARKLRLKQYASRDQHIDIQGIGKDKVSTTHKALVKVTLGWEVVYEFEVWIMPHYAGVDLILGTDFMIPAGIRLDLYNSAAKLPDELVVPLLRSLRDTDDQTYGLQTADGPTEAVCLSDRATAEFRLRRKQPSELTHEFWVRRTDDWIPTIVMNAKGTATRVYLTSTRPTSVWCPAHFPVVIWLPHGKLPPEGYVRLNSAKYRDWQILAYESAIDKDLLYKEQELYADWLSRQPPAVERKPYHWPKGVKERPPEAKKGKQLTCAERWAAVDAENKATDTPGIIAESKRIDSDDPDGLAELEGINSAMEPLSECRNKQGVIWEERDAESHLTQLDMSETCLEGQADSANEGNDDSDVLEATEDTTANNPEEGLRLRFLAAAASASDGEPATDTPGIIAESKGTDSDDPDGLAELEGINSAMEPLSECRNKQGVIWEERDAESHLTQLDKPETCLEGQADSANEANDDSGGLKATYDAIANHPEEDLRLRYLAAAASTSDDEPVAESDRRFTHFERKGETLHLEDYAHELAFLPDLSEEVPTELDYNGTNVKCSAHTPEQATRLTELLKRNEKRMIFSGNALPPPAYGVVCDIDVGDHPPIKQRARRVALKYLKPLYELLKGLLRAKLVSFSKSPWASPIVNRSQEERLCIDYKKVNAITMIMEYAIPLVDDLLSELEKYLWFCSLDASSGFWAVMMTSRARRISAFMCALGHFEWL
ncbi:Hypothetical protein PHPALM_10138, partial [Phytophthora palmivora]